MRVWEYMVTALLPQMKKQQEELNELGMEGWELVAVRPRDDWTVAYLRRQKLATRAEFKAYTKKTETTEARPSDAATRSRYGA